MSNTKNLYKRLTDPIEAFASLGDTTETPHGPLTYIDRGASILAVAHLDWVHFNPKPWITRQYQNYKIRKCPQLDDRLGAWMCIDVMSRAGIECDVLLCDSEETGNSTAQYFKSPKQYNWIMEWDRQGGGVVMYDYETNELMSALRSYDYKVEQGSFTDICELQDLGCKGFNFGVGYHKQHSHECYANLAETWDSFRKFQSFYHDYKDQHLEHEKVEYQPITYFPSYHYKWDKKEKYYRKVPQAQPKYDWDDEPITYVDDTVACGPEEGYEDQWQQKMLDQFDSEQEIAWELDVIARDLYGCEYRWLDNQQRAVVNTELDKGYLS
tara:strand:- start:370 stop:1344 length:975 start_codon:yes stop_codon:yes gene_type:complete